MKPETLHGACILWKGDSLVPPPPIPSFSVEPKMVPKRVWNSIEIEQRDEDNYYNGTSMCRACGTKVIADYLRSHRCLSYCRALAKDLGSLEDHSSMLVKVCHGGAGSGTWIHPRVAIDLARWLCPEFAVRMDSWFIVQLLHVTSPGGTTTTSSPAQLPAETIVEAATARSGTKTYGHQMQLLNETDLHHRVVAYLRRFHPRAVFLAGLGELQDTEAKRLDAWAKGYLKGQPDLLVLNSHRRHAGFALEFKTPATQHPQATPQQQQTLQRLESLGFRVLLSSDYDTICRQLDAYMSAEVFHCTCCGMPFASERAIEAHLLRKRLREVEEDDTENTETRKNQENQAEVQEGKEDRVPA